MNDAFVFDIGDFAKFGLLRIVAGQGLELGVVWYYTGGGAAGGVHVNYLLPGNHLGASMQACDGVLWTAFNAAFNGGPRTVAALQATNMLPAGTPYFAHLVPGGQRNAWLNAAVAAMQGVRVVFLDPDNGIHLNPGGNLLPGNVYVTEIEAFWNAGHSLIIYEHQNRWAGCCFEDQVSGKQDAIQAVCGIRPSALRWRRLTTRAFFFVTQERDSPGLQAAIQNLTQFPWAPHFELMP